jgi:hypothetical protein
VQRGLVLRLAVVVAWVASAVLASVRDVAADTGPPSPEGMVESGQFPIALATGALVVAVLYVAVRVPGTRRWIGAVGILAATAVALLVILFVGTVGGWSGKPMEPWTIPAMILAGIGGVVLAGLVVLRYRPR